MHPFIGFTIDLAIYIQEACAIPPTPRRGGESTVEASWASWTLFGDFCGLVGVLGAVWGAWWSLLEAVRKRFVDRLR
eukprot:2064217-Pyramimonas_sp.AAC.1